MIFGTSEFNNSKPSVSIIISLVSLLIFPENVSPCADNENESIYFSELNLGESSLEQLNKKKILRNRNSKLFFIINQFFLVANITI